MARFRNTPVLELRDLAVVYKSRGQPPLQAVKNVSLNVRRGKSLGIVGESGCGKTSLARAITGIIRTHSGSLLFEGSDVSQFDARRRRLYRRKVQMIFQDASGSLNPRMTTRQTLAEVFTVHRLCSRDKIGQSVEELLTRVALPLKLLEAYPREMSGGQCQRVSIARCLALQPELIIADEPVSALDVSVQARILNLLRVLQLELQLTMIMISHDLAVVRHVCDEVAVMYNGELVECGPTVSVLEHPRHSYTLKLLAAVPDVNRTLKARSEQL
jgi:ABC-type glutathione transport system ATPase component